MPQDKYVRILVGSEELDIPTTDKLNIGISYSLEDRENFQQKNNSNALNIKVPPTLQNSKIANTFKTTAVRDLTPTNEFGNTRSGVIEANGQDLLVGKSYLVSDEFEFSFYGNNGDWIIDLNEMTLFDVVQSINLVFSKSNIIDSWNFDGSKPYVFAPVRYGEPMDNFDSDMKPEYMKPSLNKYWILINTFKAIGYRVKSMFLESTYFKRQFMPWTWGNFLYSDGTRLESLGFLAKGPEISRWNSSYTEFLNLQAQTQTDGAFDTNGVFSYINDNTLRWTYLPAYQYGLLSATFYIAFFIDSEATKNSDVEVRIQWFHNGQRIVLNDDNGNGTSILDLNASSTGKDTYIGLKEMWASFNVVPGDTIEVKIYSHQFDSGLGHSRLKIAIDSFKIDYIKIPMGGNIDFSTYNAFKKYKILDYIGGIIDEFDLCIQTDPVTKTVYMEPAHPYSLTNNLAVTVGGYFNGTYVDWTDKLDRETKEPVIDLFNDYDRELTFKYKDDNNDGSVKIVQNRYQNNLASAKYVFPDRFKLGKKEIGNRFFSTVVHYDVVNWKGLKTNYPQMVCLIPENISTSSRAEAQTAFEPKSVYYKGLEPDTGWIFDGEVQDKFPYMFAVNYRAGGENDPILSYCDEIIGPNNVIGKGLLRRFYLQRLEIMRNGQYMTAYFKLNNSDIANFLHREFIVINGEKWELTDIKDYKPMNEESTQVLLRKWVPIQKH